MAITKKTDNTGARKELEKAKAFLNFSLPTRDGKTIRLYALPLVESNDTHKQIIDYLTGADLKKGEFTDEVKAEREGNISARIQTVVGYPRNAEDSALAL